MTPDKPIPAWKEQARELVHDAIMDAARATFAEHGYEGATVDEIAARAEVSKGTIYNYVEGGKAGLFVGVLRGHFDELHALAERHLPADGLPVRDRFRAFASAVMTYFDVHRDLLRVHLREVPQLLVSDEGGAQADQLRAQRDRIVETIAETLGHAVEAGEIRPVPVLATAHVAFGTLMGYLHPSVACRPQSTVEPEAAAAFLTDLLFDGLVVGHPGA